MSVVVLPYAQADIRSASDWYENQQPGLGRRFRRQIVEAIERIADPERGYGTAYMSLSRVFVKKFPFLIYFKTDVKRSRTVIYAVLHKKQDRNYILERRLL